MPPGNACEECTTHGIRLVWSPTYGNKIHHLGLLLNPRHLEKRGHLEPRHLRIRLTTGASSSKPLICPVLSMVFLLGLRWISSSAGLLGLCLVCGGARLDAGCSISHPALLQTADYFQALDLVEAQGSGRSPVSTLKNAVVWGFSSSPFFVVGYSLAA